jgi:hypothetical protein
MPGNAQNVCDLMTPQLPPAQPGALPAPHTSVSDLDINIHRRAEFVAEADASGVLVQRIACILVVIVVAVIAQGLGY